FASVNRFDSVTSVLDGEVCAQQTDRDCFFAWSVATAGEIRMTHSKLAADRRDQIREIRTMLNIRKKRLIFVIDRLPVCAVHLRVIEELALNPPGLAKDLRPLGSWIYQRFKLRNINWSITHLFWAIGWNDSPAVSAA